MLQLDLRAFLQLTTPAAQPSLLSSHLQDWQTALLKPKKFTQVTWDLVRYTLESIRLEVGEWFCISRKTPNVAVAMIKVINTWVSVTWEPDGKATVISFSPKLPETLGLVVEPSICINMFSMYLCHKFSFSILEFFF